MVPDSDIGQSCHLMSLVNQVMLRLRTLTQVALTVIGARLTAAHVQELNSMINYIEVGRWLRSRGFTPTPRHADRWLLYAAIAERIQGDRVLFLEFGVYEGYTLRRWAELLTHPATSLHGFDSFMGLPEDWDECARRGGVA